jgi:hypothetical protein
VLLGNGNFEQALQTRSPRPTNLPTCFQSQNARQFLSRLSGWKVRRSHKFAHPSHRSHLASWRHENTARSGVGRQSYRSTAARSELLHLARIPRDQLPAANKSPSPVLWLESSLRGVNPDSLEPGASVVHSSTCGKTQLAGNQSHQEILKAAFSDDCQDDDFSAGKVSVVSEGRINVSNWDAGGNRQIS